MPDYANEINEVLDKLETDVSGKWVRRECVDVFVNALLELMTRQMVRVYQERG